MDPRFESSAVGSSIDTAIRLSHLRSLPRETKDRLIATASLLTVPAGGTLHREGDAAVHLELVVAGMLRVYVTALDGRTLTVRYCRPGAILGAVSLFSSPFTMPASVQAITDADILAMSAPTARNAAEHDLAVARAMIEELSDRVMSFVAEIPGSAFATVRQKVARHLLDLASATQQGGELRVALSQQALADAIGTSREVVVRALRELRTDGSIETGHGGISLVDPASLMAEAYPGSVGA